jgi:pterin-4a-carbinolamine dehydratase
MENLLSHFDSSFMDAIDFVNEIAKIAETLDHHPIITINWKVLNFL